MKNWKFRDYLAALENGTSVLIICIICFTILFQVTSRFLFKVPLSWTEEVSRFSLIWLTFIAASLALRDNGHFAVDVISHRLPNKYQKWYQIGIMLFMLTYLVVILKTGFTLVPIAHMQESPALDIHMSYVYLSIPCGAALMIINILLKIHGLATAK
jgi:TRAP-type C4-dicarboxylate transport system permease small subunit